MKFIRAAIAFTTSMFAVAVAVAEPQSSFEFLLWGFDKIELASTSTGRDPINVKDAVRRGTIQNIVSVSRSPNQVSAVAQIPSASASDGLSLILVRAGDTVQMERHIVPGLLRASLSPRDQRAALTTCQESGCDIAILDLATMRSEIVFGDKATSSSFVTWHPSANEVAFEAPAGRTTILSLTSRVTRDTVGTAPAWSPDGSSLALVRNRELVLYDLNSGKTDVLAKRWFWQTPFVGPVSWNQNGTHLLVNASSGLTGYSYDCLVINTKTRELTRVYSGSLVCGPWT